jgi:hypothetical protein
MLLLMVKKQCFFCSFWLKCTKIIIEDSSKVEENIEAAQNFLAGMQTLAIFQAMRLKQVMALEAQISKAAQLSTSDAASLLSLLEEDLWGCQAPRLKEALAAKVRWKDFVGASWVYDELRGSSAE